MSKAAFDEYSSAYEEALEQGISVSGENSIYFAKGRILWLKKILKRLGFSCQSVLDFGCGVGNSLPLLNDILPCPVVAGVDVSSQSIAQARMRFQDRGFILSTTDQWQMREPMDMAFCNGVFHHIPVADRAQCASWVHDRLRPGGLFALFENNPLNPGTRYIMSRIPFDRDAVTLMPWTTRALLRSAGFEIVRTDYLFFFPKLLAFMRSLEPALHRLPLGAQYLVLARKPEQAAN